MLLDLGLVKMDDTRQLPLGPDGKIIVELLPGVVGAAPGFATI